MAVTWSRLDCFRLKWAFSLARSPYPVSAMVLAGEQPWGVGGDEIWFGARDGIKNTGFFDTQPRGKAGGAWRPVLHLVILISVHDGMVSSALWHCHLVYFFRA